jgi:endoglucanase
MKRHKKHFCSLVFILSLGFTLIIVFFIMENWQREETKRFVKQLGPGFNLGNTLDTHDLHFETNNPSDFETYWGNPVTTREMIQDIKTAGFDVLRIPVTWYEHMDTDDMIDQAWFQRVQQVVDYGLEAGLYVIINSHHDNWYTPKDENLPKAREKMSRLWIQIAERFKEYDQRLLFESMNEPRLIGEKEEWGEGTPRSREIVNELNEIFVETVRASGGENANRYLVLPAYCARADDVILKDFRLPKGNRLILSVHLYLPYEFCLNIKGTSQFHQEELMDTEEINKVFRDLERFFCKQRCASYYN